MKKTVFIMALASCLAVKAEVTAETIANRLQAQIEAGQAIQNRADAETGLLSAEDAAELDKVSNNITQLKNQLAAINSANEVQNLITQPTTPRPVGDPANSGLSRQEQRDLSQFRILNVISAAVNQQPLTGIEAEMAQEAQREAQNHGRTINGYGIPEMILHFNPQNANLTTGAGTGGEFVETRNGSIIDALRANLTLTSLGATYLSDLRGNVEFPIISDGAKGTNKNENEAGTDVTPTTASSPLNPVRLPIFMNLSRSLIAQSSYDVEMWVRGYLASLLAEGQESHAIAKILATVGIGSVDFAGAPSHDKLVALKAAVRGARANKGRLGFLTNTDVQSKCEVTKLDAGSGKFLYEEGSGTLSGKPVEFTDLVPNDGGVGTDESSIIYGNWADLFMGQWGGLDLIVNPYSGDTQGLVRVTATTLHEALVSRPASFAKGTGVATNLV